ncbi:MAG TPA: sigma-70 family RNA polymerase sigma factor [Vicinamibacterales bacterium]|nr:sigma-70 family RNA polymerase sigma factor [Vicinamibacterales bacterium]
MESNTLALSAHVPAAARGDRDAFAALVDSTRSVVTSIALAIVRDVDLSRDISQDVFLAAWRDLGQLRDPNSFLPWLRQLTRNRAYHVLRTERRRTRRLDDRDLDALVGTAVDPAPTASETLLAEEERRLLKVVLGELPDDAREVVTLYYREDQSTAHVASLLGLTEANVRQRLARARARLRAELLDRYGAAAAKSRPGARFTAGVMIAVTMGAPAASSAATLTAAASGGSWIVKAAMMGSGALLGAAGGIAGVLAGARHLKRQARSIEELDAIKRFTHASVGVVILAAVLFPVSWAMTHKPISQVLVFVLFFSTLTLMHLVWLPRITRDRHLLEALENPARAARARAMERRAALFGLGLGLLTGGMGVIAGLLLAR